MPDSGDCVTYDIMLRRRDFLKLVGAVGAGLFLDLYHADMVKALEYAATSGVKLVWMQGQSDTGCTISLLQGRNPDIYEAIMNLSLDISFHPTIMSAHGERAMSALNIEPDVLVIEGSIPGPEFSTVGERPVIELVKELAGKTKKAVVAVGTCAAYGGIPAASGNVTNSTGVQYSRSIKGGVLGSKFVSRAGLPVVNLPGCPAHPDHVLLTLAALILGNNIQLDEKGRPALFFKEKVHDQCARLEYFKNRDFATDFHETDISYKKCLLKLGCRGPLTCSDCATRQWNGGINACVHGGGAPCIGCFHEGFPDRMSPLFNKV